MLILDWLLKYAPVWGPIVAGLPGLFAWRRTVLNARRGRTLERLVELVARQGDATHSVVLDQAGKVEVFVRAAELLEGIVQEEAAVKVFGGKDG